MQRRRVALASRIGGASPGHPNAAGTTGGFATSDRMLSRCRRQRREVVCRQARQERGRECALKLAGCEAVIGAKLPSPSARHSRASHQATRASEGRGPWRIGRARQGFQPESRLRAGRAGRGPSVGHLGSPSPRPFGQKAAPGPERTAPAEPPASEPQVAGLGAAASLGPARQGNPAATQTGGEAEPTAAVLASRRHGGPTSTPAHQRPASAPVPASGGAAPHPEAIPKPAIRDGRGHV